MTKLPTDFLWGNSVSSMQTEGAWNLDGKGMSTYDIRKIPDGYSDWKVATDSYHRYLEDFDYMEALGMTCYRFQISWSRVDPTGEGIFNEQGIAFYDTFIDELLKRGIEPMICLYHFDMPLNLAEKYNGFTHRKVVDYFANYGQEMLKRFGHKVKYWLTFNEQNLCHMGAFDCAGHIAGAQTVNDLYLIEHHLMLAHARVANHLHQYYPSCQIGGMITYMEIYPATCKPKDVFVARKTDEFFNQNLLQVFSTGTYSTEVLNEMERLTTVEIIKEGDLAELAKMTSDYIAISYYSSMTISGEQITTEMPVHTYHHVGEVKNDYLEATEWGWQIDALGFRNAINQTHAKSGLPVFPIENGIGVIEEWDGQTEINDSYRINYHHDHIQAMKDAIFLDGVPVIGYLGWGLIDILSSQGDMRKRYGVVYVNRDNLDLKDLARIPKKSFYWFKKVIASNGEELTRDEE